MAGRARKVWGGRNMLTKDEQLVVDWMSGVEPIHRDELVKRVAGGTGLTWNRTRTIIKRLQVYGLLHVARRERSGGRGGPRVLYGVRGVHPYAPSLDDEVQAALKKGPVWPQDLAEALGISRTAVVVCAERLGCTKETRGRLVYYKFTHSRKTP